MIRDKTLSFLIKQKKADDEALFRERRYAGAIYIMGYAIEITLKRKICTTLGFQNGFPKNQPE